MIPTSPAADRVVENRAVPPAVARTVSPPTASPPWLCQSIAPDGLWPGVQLLASKVFPQLNGLLWAAMVPTPSAACAAATPKPVSATTTAATAARLIPRRLVPTENDVNVLPLSPAGGCQVSGRKLTSIKVHGRTSR